MKGCQIFGIDKKVDDLEIIFATLQWDKEGLQQQVQVHETEILKFKEEIQSIVHQRDDVMCDKDKT